MSAPDFVPVDPTSRVRRYASPSRRSGSWFADRPGDLVSGQPRGIGMGCQGPDQGFVYKLLPLFDGQLQLGSLSEHDAAAGCIEVALKRAAHFGRAPVVHDLRMAFTLFGFLDPEAPAELVDNRERWFAGVGHAHHYAERRSLVDRVSVDALSTSPDALHSAYRRNWKSNLTSID